VIKDKKVKGKKQKPSDACPAQLMLIAIKCPLIQHTCSNTHVEPTPSVKILENDKYPTYTIHIKI